jgi:hypothetical protein
MNISKKRGGVSNTPSLTFQLIETHARRLLAETASAYVDFGALYAKPDAILATAFKDTNSFAVDGSPEIKQLNQSAFGERANLRFVASDIFDFLSHMKFDDG